MKKIRESKTKKERYNFADRPKKIRQFIFEYPSAVIGIMIVLVVLIPCVYRVQKQVRKDDAYARAVFCYAMEWFDADYREWDQVRSGDLYKAGVKWRYVYANIDRKTESFVPYYTGSAGACIQEIEEKGLAGALGMSEETADLVWKGLKERYMDSDGADRDVEMIYDHQVLYGGCSLKNEEEVRRFFNKCYDIDVILKTAGVDVRIQDKIHERTKAIRRVQIEQAAEPQLKTQ